MKTLLKNGFVVNVFTGEILEQNVLVEDERIVGVGNYADSDADHIEDAAGKYICPGFIDGHIHIESTMLLPSALAQVSVPHGTTTIIADPHEIANVSGADGIRYLLTASENIPMNVFFMLPSCVPSTPLDESGAVLDADSLLPFYQNPRVLGLGEVMNYSGVIHRDPDLLRKIQDACRLGKILNGHAPLLTGKDLDAYIAAGIQDDHECSAFEEAVERIQKGQCIMIRQGTAARNLENLLPLFDSPWSGHCMLVSDDRHPADLLSEGHVDSIIRAASAAGKSPIVGIQMATIQAARHFGLRHLGAVAPGYLADILILDDLDSVSVRDVYFHGRKIVANRVMGEFSAPRIPDSLQKKVMSSFQLTPLSADNFHIRPQGSTCRVIRLIPKQLLTEELILDLDFSRNNGVDPENDIVKLAVVERHHHTGHMGLGFITGTGIKHGAIASSVSHDSHNLVVIGTNQQDMAIAANRIAQLGGGYIAVDHGKVIGEMALPIAGLMTPLSALEAAAQNEAVRAAVHTLGVPPNRETFMTMSFMCLPVIPDIKMTTHGLVRVADQKLVPLFVSQDSPESP